METKTGACPYCGSAGGHAPECPTQFVAEKQGSGRPSLVDIRKRAQESIIEDAEAILSRWDGSKKSEKQRLAQYQSWASGAVDEERRANYPNWDNDDFTTLQALRDNPLAVLDQKERENDAILVDLFKSGINQHFDTREYYLSLDALEEYIITMFESIVEQRGLDPIKLKISMKCTASERDKDPEDRTDTYTVSVDGRIIFTYNISGDYSGPRIQQWYEQNIQAVLQKIGQPSLSPLSKKRGKN